MVTIPYKTVHSVEAANNSRRTFDLVAAIDHAAVKIEPPLLTTCAGQPHYGLGGRSLTKAECRRAVDALAVGEMVANITGDGCHVWTNPYHTASRFSSVPANGTVEITMCGRARRGYGTGWEGTAGPPADDAALLGDSYAMTAWDRGASIEVADAAGPSGVHPWAAAGPMVGHFFLSSNPLAVAVSGTTAAIYNDDCSLALTGAYYNDPQILLELNRSDCGDSPAVALSHTGRVTALVAGDELRIVGLHTTVTPNLTEGLNCIDTLCQSLTGPFSLAVSGDGQVVAVGGQHGYVAVFERGNLTTVWLGMSRPAASIALSFTGDTVAVGYRCGTGCGHARVYTRAGYRLTTVEANSAPVVALSGDGTTLAVGTADTLRVKPLNSQAPTYEFNTDASRSVALSHDGTVVLAVGDNRQTHIAARGRTHCTHHRDCDANQKCANVHVGFFTPVDRKCVTTCATETEFFAGEATSADVLTDARTTALHVCGDAGCGGYYGNVVVSWSMYTAAPLRSKCREPLDHGACTDDQQTISMPDTWHPSSPGCYEVNGGRFYSDGCPAYLQGLQSVEFRGNALMPTLNAEGEVSGTMDTVAQLYSKVVEGPANPESICPRRCTNHADCGGGELCATPFDFDSDWARECVPRENCTTARDAQSGHACGDPLCTNYFAADGGLLPPLRTTCSRAVSRAACDHGQVSSMPNSFLPADPGCYATSNGYFYSDGCELVVERLTASAQKKRDPPRSVCGDKCGAHADCPGMCATLRLAEQWLGRSCVEETECASYSTLQGGTGHLCGDPDCPLYFEANRTAAAPLRSTCSRPQTACAAETTARPAHKLPADPGCYAAAGGHFYSDGCVLELDLPAGAPAGPEPVAVCAAEKAGVVAGVMVGVAAAAGLAVSAAR